MSDSKDAVVDSELIQAVKGGALHERDGDLWLHLANGIHVQLTKTGDWQGILDDDDEPPESAEAPNVYVVVGVFSSGERVECVADSPITAALEIVKRYPMSGMSYRIEQIGFVKGPG